LLAHAQNPKNKNKKEEKERKGKKEFIVNTFEKSQHLPPK
jgi:hypothetical protein